MTTASYANWKPYENYLQSGGEGPGMVDGKFVTGAFMGIFAGPPRLGRIGGVTGLIGAVNNPAVASTIVYPVGITQNMNLSHNRQFSRIFELGTERSYFVSGRTIGQLGLSRILYHGPSILRVLYAYYQDVLPPTLIPSVFPNLGAAADTNPHNVILPPGYENFYINLASDLFTQPIGLLIMVKDNRLDTYGAFYLESCYLPNHTFATDAQGVIVQESVAVQFELAIPISVTNIQLVA
jgi:hypothetical protein